MSEAFVILNYSRVIKAVQYNSENDSWTTWLSTLKKDIPKVSKDAKSLFKELDSGKLKVTDWQGYCNSVKMTDETLISFLQDTKYGTKDLASYQQYLKKSSQSMTLFQRAGKAAGTAMKGLMATLGSMAATWAIGEVISLVATWLDNIVHKAEKTSEKMDELFEKSSENNETYKKQIDSLEEYKQNYQDILNSADSELDKRKSLIELQGNINSLSGSYVESLDLVNGKLDEQLGKITKIEDRKKSEYWNNAVGNYTNAKKSANQSVGQYKDDGFFGTGLTFVYKESNIDDSLKKVLEKNGYGNLISSGNENPLSTLFSSPFDVQSSISLSDDIDAYGNVQKSLQERVKYLKDLQEVLLKSGQGSSGFYGAVTSQIETWEKKLDAQKKAATDLIQSYVYTNANPNNINSVDDYEKYVKDFTKKLKKDGSISEAIKDGTLNEDELSSIVQNYMSVLNGFSTWYDKWKKKTEKKASSKTTKDKELSSDDKKNVFNDAWDSLKDSEQKKFTKLVNNGKLTVETFNEIGDSAKALKETGLSVDELCDKIRSIVGLEQKLSNLSSSIKKVATAYKDFKKNGFVSTQSLNAMPDSFKNLDGYSKFSKIAGNKKSSKKEIQGAFNDIVTEYISTSNLLDDITKKNKEKVVTALRDAGITNAQQLVDYYSTEEKLLKKSTDELNKKNDNDLQNYIDMLNEKGIKTADVNNKIGESNGSLFNALSVLYKQDLLNWVEALKEKKRLYNNFVDQVKDAQGDTTSEKYKNAVTTLSGKKKGQSDYDYVTSAAGSASRYNKANQEEKKTRNQVNIDLKKIKGKFSANYKPTSSSNSKSKSGSSSKKNDTIDWIERRLNQLQSTIDYTSAKLQNLFTIKAKTNNIGEQIKETTKLIKAEGTAAEKYRKKANSIKLSFGLKKAVREGRLNGYSMKQLIATYGEKTANKIQTYQDYYDKYQSARQAKEEKIAARRQLRIDRKQVYVDNAEALYNINEARKENAKTASGKNSFLNKEVKNLKESYKYQKQIAKIQYGKNSEQAKAELARLEAEEQKKLLDIEIEKHQNVLDEYNTENDAYDAQKENLKTAKEKNSVISQQEALTRKIYDEQIAIAKLQYGDGSKEVIKLQEELSTKLANYENDKFENIQIEYGNWLDMVQARIDGLDGSISIVEAKGITATQDLYKGKLQIEQENLSTLQAEKTALEEQHKSTEVGTALWYSQEKSLNDVSTAIITAQKNMIEYRNSIREANDKVLELKKSFIDLGNIYLNNFEKYLSRYSLTDEDTGGLTDKGVATLGIYRKQSISAGEQQKIDMDKLNEIEDIIARYNIYDDTQKKILLEANNYDSFAQVKEDYEKYAQAVQDDISNRISAEENIINLMKERYNAELSYIQKLIDDRKQQLSDEKDLYDYQKSIQEKVDNISLLQKQLDALRNDGSEEAMQKRNSIQDQLDNAKEDLMDVEYDKYISDQQNMLDKLSEDYQNLIEDLLKDVDTLLNEGNEIAKNNGDKFEKAINGFTEKYGQTPFTQQQIDVAAIKTAVEKEQKDQDAADEVLSAIEKIGTVDLNGEGRGRLVNAENLYNSLTDVQRKIVDENPNGLTLLQKKQQEWIALQTPTQTSMPTSQPSTPPQQSATEAKRAEERKNQQKAQFEQLIKNTYWQNAKYGTKKLFKDNGKETDYTKVQKKIAKNYKRDDFRYVNADWIKEVCKRLGIAQSAGSLLNYMNGIGFSRGGIVETLSKVPGRNGDDGWATLKRGEAILTPEQTKMFQSMIKQMPVFTNAMDIFSSTKSSMGVNNKPNSVSVGDINLTLDLPNVTDPESFIKEMQSNSRMRKVVQQAVLDEVVGKGNFNIKRL